MSGLKLFWSLIQSSMNDVLASKQIYLPAFISLIFLGNLETFFPFMGAAPESNSFIILTILATIASFIVLSQVVLIQKKNNGGIGELKYFVPTFLLYNLYYSFLFFMGLLLLVIPGLYILIFFSMVPFVAVLNDEHEGSYFKESKRLVKKNIGLVAWACLINLLVELSGLLITPIANPIVKGVANLLFSIPDAFITIVMTMTMVKIYYLLKSHE
jgi:hypothetical protein